MADWTSPEFIDQAVQLYRAKIYSANYGAQSVSLRQKLTTKEVTPRPPTWISKFDIQGPPEGDARKLLCQTIDHYDDNHGPYDVPEIGRIEGHWVGYSRSDVIVGLEKSLSETKRWRAMKGQTSRPSVVFWIYGGTFCLNGPGQYYPVLTRIAKETEGRCFCVKQRLAPQNPFPAALLDIFHGYLSLIAPPPGSVHQPIPPSDIVIGGDSSGGTLALNLLQLLLTIKRERFAETLTFYGQEVSIADWLPAGIACMCPAADIANGLPSYRNNAKYDIFPLDYVAIRPDFPACEAWPTSPPRGNLYCNPPYLYHPAANPAMCPDWTESPPMWFGCGQEQVVDGARFLIQTAAAHGVNVTYTEYQGMPHSWPVVFTDAPQSQKFWTEMVSAIVAMTEGKKAANKAVFVRPDLTEEELQIGRLVPFTREDVRRWSMEETAKLVPFTGKSTVRSSKI